MKRFIYVCFILLFTIFSTSCKNNMKLIISEDEAVTADENDYLKADIKTVDKNIVYYKETVDFVDLYPAPAIKFLEKTNIPDGSILHSIDNKGNIFIITDPNSANECAEIFSYNLLNERLSSLIKIQKGHYCTIAYVTDKYLIWTESDDDSWRKTKHHIYCFDSKNDIIFYENTVNPDTGFTYGIPFYFPIIINDTVYFDDIISVDEKQNYKILLYSYNIKQRKITTLWEDAKIPMEYQDRLAWIGKSSDEKNSVFCSENIEGKGLIKTTNRLGTTFSSLDDVVVLNDYLSEALYNTLNEIYKGSKAYKSNFLDTVNDPSISSYGIKFYNDKSIEPIMVVSKGFVTNPVTNGSVIGWHGSSIGAPMYYDIKKDKLIRLNTLSNNDIFDYSILLCDKYILISYVEYGENAKMKYALIKQ